MEPHSHVFLGKGHEHAEYRTWAVIWLCGAMMAVEVSGGWLFGSIALVADGMHMSTHAGALLLAALAYRYARRHAADTRFTFGTGKLGDLAGFTSAIVLAMIALLIAWEAITRLLAPVPIAFGEAIPIACLGLGVNIASAWLLNAGHHDHHRHGEHGSGEHAHEANGHDNHAHPHDHADHAHPHDHADHAHHSTHRDNNMRAAVVHVIADAAVSVLVIVGLLLARAFGWLWMDPLAGLIGAFVIASWAYGLTRDTGSILLDMNPDRHLTERLRRELEADGDRITDLHVWRLGPGHLGAVLSIVTQGNRRAEDYRERLRHFPSLSHVTVEVHPR
jgi:cation diffusion facilitator family transporter